MRTHATRSALLSHCGVGCGFLGETTCAISTDRSLAPTVAPSAVKAALRTVRIGMIERLHQGRRGIDAPLTDQLDQHRLAFCLRLWQDAQTISGIRLVSPGRPASAVFAACASSASASLGEFPAGATGWTRRPSARRRRSPRCELAWGRSWRLPAPPAVDRRSLRSAKATSNERRSLRAWRGQLRPPGHRRLRAQAARGPCSGRVETTLVVRAKLLDQQRDPVGLAGQNRAASRFEDILLGNFGLADFVVDLRRFVRLSVGQQTLGAQDAAFGNRRTDLGGRAGQRSAQRLGRRRHLPMRPRATAAADGDLGILVLQMRGQGIDGGIIAANADRVDRADQQLPLSESIALRKRFVGFRTGNRFQRDPRPRGQLLVGQQLAPGPAPPAPSRGRPAACRRSLSPLGRVRAEQSISCFFFGRVRAVGGLRRDAASATIAARKTTRAWCIRRVIFMISVLIGRLVPGSLRRWIFGMYVTRGTLTASTVRAALRSASGWPVRRR